MSRFTTVLKICLLLAALSLGTAAWCGPKPGIVLAPKTPEEKHAADLLIQGSQLLKAKKAFAARPLLERAVGIWPSSPHAQFNLALCYMEVGNFPKAIEGFQTSYRLDQRITDALADIGTCYQMMNQPNQAIPWFEEYLRKEPHADDADKVRGMINALRKASSKQVDANPQGLDYLDSICPRGRIQRWQQQRIPLKIFISNGTDESGIPVRGFREYYNEILVDSFDAWMKASQNRLAYRIVDDVKTADIVCTWTDKSDFLREKGNAVEQGAARVAARPINEREEEIGHVRVVILIADIEGKGNISDDTLKKACLHEIGHALGFAGHSNNNRDVMFFSESPTVWAALTKRDKATMARLYGDYQIQAQPQLEQSYAPQQPVYAQQPQIPPQYAQYGQQPQFQTQYAQPQMEPNGYPSGDPNLTQYGNQFPMQ